MAVVKTVSVPPNDWPRQGRGDRAMPWPCLLAAARAPAGGGPWPGAPVERYLPRPDGLNAATLPETIRRGAAENDIVATLYWPSKRINVKTRMGA